jgi:hypothetical protein
MKKFKPVFLWLLLSLVTLVETSAKSAFFHQNHPVVETKVVTVVKVKAPWYALGSLLRSAFKKAIPQYQAVDGLEFKSFSIGRLERGKHFGGIYLWENRTKAEKWFSPAWFQRVREKRKTEGQVTYYDVVAVNNWTPANFDFTSVERHSVTVFIPGLDAAQVSKLLTPQAGLLNAYTVQVGEKLGLFLLFETDKKSRQFLQQNGITTFERFETPVLLKNS